MTKKENLLKEHHFIYKKETDKWINQKHINVQISGLYVRNLNINVLKHYVEDLFSLKKEEIKSENKQGI